MEIVHMRKAGIRDLFQICPTTAKVHSRGQYEFCFNKSP